MSRPRTPWLIGWEAAKANAAPAFVLQLAMLGILLAYYFHPATARLLNELAEYKLRHGIVFVLVASIVVGAVLPELFTIVFLQRGRVEFQNARNFLFNAPFWALDGFLVNAMYTVLAAWLGDRATVPVVAAKICIDQFGYNPFLAVPLGIWGYAWKNNRYSFARLRPLLTWEYYRQYAFPVLVTTWAVWLPVMAVIYSLPYALQFPLFALALAFWVLMLTYMTGRFHENHAVIPSEPEESRRGRQR